MLPKIENLKGLGNSVKVCDEYYAALVKDPPKKKMEGISFDVAKMKEKVVQPAKALTVI